jgi:hypothetical protein
MTAFRWGLGALAASFALGWVALFAAATGFRASLGASPTALWKGVLPVAASLLVLASVLWPDRRAQLHLTAVAVACVLAGSVLLARAAPLVATLGVLYAACWMAFYVRAAWQGAPVALR